MSPLDRSGEYLVLRWNDAATGTWSSVPWLPRSRCARHTERAAIRSRQGAVRARSAGCTTPRRWAQGVEAHRRHGTAVPQTLRRAPSGSRPDRPRARLMSMRPARGDRHRNPLDAGAHSSASRRRLSGPRGALGLPAYRAVSRGGPERPVASVRSGCRNTAPGRSRCRRPSFGLPPTVVRPRGALGLPAYRAVSRGGPERPVASIRPGCRNTVPGRRGRDRHPPRRADSETAGPASQTASHTPRLAR